MLQREKRCGAGFFKRLLTVALAVVLLLGMIPSGMMEVQAAESIETVTPCQFTNPSYEFTTVDGKTINSTVVDKPKLLVFFNANCSNCRRMIQGICKAEQNYTGVDIIAAEYSGRLTEEGMKAFQNDYRSKVITYVYGNDVRSKMYGYLGAAGVHTWICPLMVFIDKENQVQAVSVGIYREKSVVEMLNTYCKTNMEVPAAPSLKLPSQDEIRARYAALSWNEDLKDTYDVTPSTKSPYAAGRLSEKSLKNALDIVNFSRYVAGLPSDVKLSEEYNTLSQAGALISAANKKLSHNPTQPSNFPYELYQTGYDGCQNSNLSGGRKSLGSSIIDGWLNDSSGDNMTRVGHRRWVLSPTMSATGFGSAASYTAMYACDVKGGEEPEDYYVAWPAPNMPIEFIEDSDYPWSVSLGGSYQAAVASELTVTMKDTKSGKTWTFTEGNSSWEGDYFTVASGGYGISNSGGTIIFRPNPRNITYRAGSQYEITINGTKDKEGNAKPIQYTVNFFALNKTINNNNNQTGTNSDTTEDNTISYGSRTLNVNPVKFNTIELNWDAVQGAKSYEIFYSTSPDSNFKRLTNTKKNFYKFSRAKCGVTYYFQMRVCTKGAKSAFGPVTEAKTDLIGTPTLQVKKTTYNSISLKWSKVPGAKKYEIFYRDSVSGEWKSLGLKGGTSFTHKKLITGASYSYQIRPVRDSFYGEISNNVSSTTIFANVSKLKAKSLSQDQIKLTWKKVKGATQYIILRSDKIDGTYEAVARSTRASYTDVGLESGKTYFYKVYAVSGPYKTKATEPVAQTTRFN